MSTLVGGMFSICCHMALVLLIYIAANFPEFFVIIRKSKLEYKCPNDDFFSPNN